MGGGADLGGLHHAERAARAGHGAHGDPRELPPRADRTTGDDAPRDADDLGRHAHDRLEETAGLGWIRTIPNAAVLTAGLLYGDGDFTRTITLTVRGGLDTDSNGATAGSVAGVLCGAAAIPSQWRDPLEDTVRSAVFGFDRARISELASRTVALTTRA